MEQIKRFWQNFFSKKITCIAIRSIIIALGLIVLMMVAVSVYVSSSKEKLLGFLNTKLNETILGELRIDKADITVWRTFPNIGIVLSNVSIRDSSYHKPFLKAEDISAKINLWSIVGKKLKISSVKIENAIIYTFTDAKGYSNTYVLKPQNKEKRQSKKPVVFSNLELENVVVISEDVIKNKRYEFKIYDAEAEMALRDSKYYIKLDEDILVRGLGFNLSKGYWLENQRVQARWKFEFDTSGNILSFNNTKVKIQGQPFTINGAFFLNAPAHFTINASTKNISYNTALAMLKPITSEKLKKINFTEPLDATVLIDGSMAYKSIPLVKVSFNVKDNSINTPVMNFSKCNFSGVFINQADVNLPRTDENSQLTINAFTSSWGDIKLKAQNILITNLKQPVIRFEFSTQCTLPQLDEQLASSALKFLEGNAKLYLAYNGPLIADPSLLDQLNARIEIENGKVIYVPRNITFSECNGAVSIIGNNLIMKDFQCNLNTNNFIVNITGENLNRFSNNEPGKATINCNVYTPSLNLADFKTLFAQKNKTVRKKNKSLINTANSIDNAIENGNLYINVKATQVLLHHFNASNVTANIFFKDDDWQIKQASLQHADGNFNLTANMHQVNDAMQQATAQISLQHMNVKKLFYGFDNFGQTGITYKNLKGIIDVKASIVAGINNAGKIVPSAMNGKINFLLKNAALVNLESLKNIQQYIFKNRNLDNIEFAKLENTFEIKKGDIYIPRMPIQSSAITMYVEGIYSFEDRTDISIQVPLSSLTKRPEDYKEIDAAKVKNPGASIYLRAKDKGGQVKIGLDVFKKLRRNKFKKNNE